MCIHPDLAIPLLTVPPKEIVLLLMAVCECVCERTRVYMHECVRTCALTDGYIRLVEDESLSFLHFYIPFQGEHNSTTV